MVSADGVVEGFTVTGYAISAVIVNADRVRVSDCYFYDYATNNENGAVFWQSGTNGICERFHKTLLDEFYRVAFRKKIYDTVEALQADLDEWLRSYNEQRTHQGRWCFGKTPMRTFLDSVSLAREKQNPARAA